MLLYTLTPLGCIWKPSIVIFTSLHLYDTFYHLLRILAINTKYKSTDKSRYIITGEEIGGHSPAFYNAFAWFTQSAEMLLTLYSTQTRKDDLLFTSTINLLFTFLLSMVWSRRIFFFWSFQYFVFMAKLVLCKFVPCLLAQDKIFPTVSGTAFWPHAALQSTQNESSSELL